MARGWDVTLFATGISITGAKLRAVAAVGRLHEIDRRACRRRVESRFSIETMVRGYEAVYAKIWD